MGKAATAAAVAAVLAAGALAGCDDGDGGAPPAEAPRPSRRERRREARASGRRRRVLTWRVGLFVLAFVAWRGLFRNDSDETPTPVEWKDSVALAEREGFQVVHPRELPAGWTATSVDLTMAGEQRWGLGVLTADGTFVAMNNRVSQSVPHFHIHVVPRRRGDGLRGFFWPRQKYASDADRRAVAERIRAALTA